MLFKKKEIEVLAPFDGEIINVEAVPDKDFTTGALGKGVAVIP